MSTDDEQHLKLLAIFHYLVGALAVLFACFPLIHVGLGAMMLFSPEMMGGNDPRNQPPPEFVGWLFVTIGAIFFLVGQSIAVSIILCGRYLAKRKNYLFIFVIAAVQCMFMPFGTVLGIFTIIVLSKESVKKLFGR